MANLLIFSCLEILVGEEVCFKAIIKMIMKAACCESFNLMNLGTESLVLITNFKNDKYLLSLFSFS